MAERLRIEENERVVRFCQSGPGRLLLLLTFAGLFHPLYAPHQMAGRPPSWVILLAATICSLAGAYRAQALALTTLAGLLIAPGWFPAGWLKQLAEQQGLPVRLLFPLQLLTIAYLALITVACFRLRQRHPRSWPLPLLFLSYAVSLALAVSPLGAGPAGIIFWTGLWAFSAYLFCMAFALRDASSSQASPAWFQLATFHPYFSGSVIPLGLGAAHLRQRQARDSVALARSQLKGIKLIVACWICQGLSLFLVWLRVSAEIPEFGQIVHLHLGGHPVPPRSICWLSLLIAFPTGMVRGFVVGNILIAAARLGGFCLLQQVYQPWFARSIADYWNRVSFYYKETVLQLFFYPCYLRNFKNWPRLRMAAAIVMAAGIGNLLFHFRQLLPVLVREGPLATLRGMQTYFCYCLILCAGLYFSQRSSAQSGAALAGKQRLKNLVVVFLFYSLLGVFDELYSPYGPQARFRFLAYLWHVI